MPRGAALPGAVLFALWVGICAAAPELIWQGARILAEEGDLGEFLVSSAILGLILAFFIEPILERLKHAGGGHAEPPGTAHPAAPGIMPVLVSVGFAMVAVGFHECLGAVLHGHGPASGLGRSLETTLEWAFLPALVALVWVVGARSRLAGGLVLGLTAAAAAGVARLVFHWRLAETALSVLAAVLVSLVMLASRGRGQGEAELRRLGLGAATCLLGFVVLAGIASLAWPAIYPHVGDFWEDVRFYAGWSLGLLLAPEALAPLPATAARR
jgi:hypothetical protein